MRRILYDVPRWSIYLHRSARGLARVDASDPPERRFEDELFERLYAGDAERLPDGEQDPALREWAGRVHAACEQLPSFERLAAECRGDADAAAAAVEALVAELRPQVPQRDEAALRRAVRSACDRASAAVEAQRDASEGLEQVAFGPVPGTGTVQGEVRPSTPARALAGRIRNDHRLRRIALLAGRFKRIAAQKRRTKVRHGADEVADVEQGADLGRLLPTELGKLVHPRLRVLGLRDLAERRALQYALRGSEVLGKGPLVVCLDKSGSMDGSSDVWATAVSLALLDVAQRERRPFALLAFDADIKHEAVVMPGGQLPEAALFVSCGGGTDIAHVLARASPGPRHHRRAPGLAAQGRCGPHY